MRSLANFLSPPASPQEQCSQLPVFVLPEPTSNQTGIPPALRPAFKAVKFLTRQAILWFKERHSEFMRSGMKNVNITVQAHSIHTVSSHPRHVQYGSKINRFKVKSWLNLWFAVVFMPQHKDEWTPFFVSGKKKPKLFHFDFSKELVVLIENR